MLIGDAAYVKRIRAGAAVSFLESLKSEYPHRVEGPRSIRGSEGDRFGECVSRAIPEGRRTWAFANQADRDRFAEFIKGEAGL